MENKNADIVTMVLIVGVIAIAAAFVATTGIKKSEVVECNEWNADAQQLDPWTPNNPGGFYLAQWQADQCKAHGIIIDAPVR